MIIAGPNGAGKTTFARTFLLQDTQVSNFINADPIATGLSPLIPEKAARAAGRILLEELERLTSEGESFALESTLSGRTYVEMFKRWKAMGYRIVIVFLRMDDPKVCISRVAARVKQGGHDVPRSDVLRRRIRGCQNFRALYRGLVDARWVFDGLGPKPVLGEASMKKVTTKPSELTTEVILKGLQRAAKEARRMAKMHGTLVWVKVDGKVVGLKP